MPRPLSRWAKRREVIAFAWVEYHAGRITLVELALVIGTFRPGVRDTG